MYLLKPNTVNNYYYDSEFTFHHVSIKTHNEFLMNLLNHHSHSTMYLLKRFLAVLQATLTLNSHSTMYLLKHELISLVENAGLNSHSTMYLLKLHLIEKCLMELPKFTFHHVSIKTVISQHRAFRMD